MGSAPGASSSSAAAIDESEEEEEEERPRRCRWKIPTEAPKALADNKAFFHAFLRAKVAKDAEEEEARKAGRCEQ